MPLVTKEYRREVLFDEVWAEQMGRVASRYGVTATGLVKVCKKLHVPRPPQGYWLQKPSRRPPRPALPQLPEDASTALTIRWREEEPMSPAYEARLRRAPASGRMERPFVVPTALPKPLHVEVQAVEWDVDNATPHEGGILAFDNGPCAGLHVTRKTRARALRLLDALSREMEARGAVVQYGSFEDKAEQWAPKFHVLVEGNDFALEIREETVRTETAGSGGKPLRFGVEATGRLAFRIEGPELRWEARDTPTRRLEEKVGAVFDKLESACAAVANRKVRKEWDLAQAAEAEQRRRQLLRAQEEEEARRRLLSLQLGRWREAREVRAFVRDVRRGEEGKQPEVAAFLAWAEGYADAVDPSVRWVSR